MEEPGASGGYNGWDSFNLRVSNNAGITYSVIPGTLITPAYDFTDSYAFGSEHGEGLGVPGWGGVHEPWVTVSVDLSGYIGSSVKIRFAFASDPAYSTVDDPAMYGVMVDDIAFGGYSNNGVNDGQMTFSSLVPTAGDFWHLATDPGAPSPTHKMTCENASGTYVPYMLNYLVSPTIALPAAATQIVADFQLKGSFSDTGVFPDVDYFGWEVSVDGGFSWRYMSNPYATPGVPNYVYSSAPTTWASMINSYTLDGDITGFAGMNAKFRWYFQSNGNTPVGSPLQIDNFQIFSVTAAPAPPNLVFPVNGAVSMPIGGFTLDWAPSSLGALPEYYTVYMDMDEENLEIATFSPTYISPELTVSYYNPVTDGLLTFASNQRWFWRVGASIVGQDDAFSDIFRFDIVNAATVISTFPWTEGFEGATFPPTDWTLQDLDGDGVNWSVNTNATYVHSGTKSARHMYSDLVPEPGQNGWLITPPILLPSTGVPMLTWWVRNQYPTFMVYNGVWINNNTPTDPNWVQLWSQTTATDAWTQKASNLSAYGGQMVYIAFKYAGYDAEVWYVDDVGISILTTDETAPTITHLPIINTVRNDIPYQVNADIADDPIWNNPITVANMYYSTDGGSNWSAPVPMTPGTAPAYSAQIPAMPHGTAVTYKMEAKDSANNWVYAGNFSFQVNSPVWLQYHDHIGLGYTGFPTYVWGPMIYYPNPLYGTGTPLQILGTSGAVHNNNTGNPPTVANLHVYSDDGEDLVDLITPLPVTLPHRTVTVTDLSAYNIMVTTPFFWISYEDMPTGCYFLIDNTYNYTTLYLKTGGSIYYSTNPGEWGIGAYAQIAPMGLNAPEVSIALVGGSPVLNWPAVPGAASYQIYSAMNPYAADPWTLIGNTGSLSYTDSTPAGKEFYKVVANTAAPSRGSVVGMPVSKSGIRELLARPAQIEQ